MLDKLLELQYYINIINFERLPPMPGTRDVPDAHEEGNCFGEIWDGGEKPLGRLKKVHIP
jgi:hypothetical protein